MAEREGRPAKTCSNRPPAIAESRIVEPTSVGVQIPHTRVIVGGTDVLLRIIRSGAETFLAARHPRVEVVACGCLSDHDRRRVARADSRRPALRHLHCLLFGLNGDAALVHHHGAAVIVVVHAKIGAAIGNRGEVAAGHGKDVAARRVHIKCCRALAQDELRDARAVAEGQLVEFQHRIVIEIGRCAILKFHGGAAVAR